MTVYTYKVTLLMWLVCWICCLLDLIDILFSAACTSVTQQSYGIHRPQMSLLSPTRKKRCKFASKVLCNKIKSFKMMSDLPGSMAYLNCNHSILYIGEPLEFFRFIEKEIWEGKMCIIYCEISLFLKPVLLIYSRCIYEAFLHKPVSHFFRNLGTWGSYLL